MLNVFPHVRDSRVMLKKRLSVANLQWVTTEYRRHSV